MFQLKVLFKLENNHLPKEMDRLMLSFFKAATERYSKDMAGIGARRSEGKGKFDILA